MALPKLRIGSTIDEHLVHPNHLIYSKMEEIVQRMLDELEGVPIKTVKSFMSKIPSIFTGGDLVTWIMKTIACSDLGEALHLAHLLACHGYLFPIDDHVLTVKSDGTFYRFQTPYFWPSNCWEPENTDYAVYLCKRTMQNKAHLELEDFEAENLAKLQKMFSRKWEFIFMQAEAQYKVDKKRDRLERQILDSQERAFWDVHRPVPGSVNTTEVDFRKLSRSGRPKYSSGIVNTHLHPDPGSSGPPPPLTSLQMHKQMPGLRRCTLIQDTLMNEIGHLQGCLAKNVLKTSKVIETHIGYFHQRVSFDPYLCPTEPQNPWISDTVDFWQNERITGEISARRVKLWALSFDELLSDTAGRETLQKFLDKEYSGENLRFWWEVQMLRKSSSRMVPVLVTKIYNEFVGQNAGCPVNIDSKVMDTTEENLTNPNRWSFDEAAEHIYCLMKNDSYQRFLRSDVYRDLVNNSKKKTAGKVATLRSVISFPGKREATISAVSM